MRGHAQHPHTSGNNLREVHSFGDMVNKVSSDNRQKSSAKGSYRSSVHFLQKAALKESSDSERRLLNYNANVALAIDSQIYQQSSSSSYGNSFSSSKSFSDLEEEDELPSTSQMGLATQPMFQHSNLETLTTSVKGATKNLWDIPSQSYRLSEIPQLLTTRPFPKQESRNKNSFQRFLEDLLPQYGSTLINHRQNTQQDQHYDMREWISGNLSNPVSTEQERPLITQAHGSIRDSIRSQDLSRMETLQNRDQSRTNLQKPSAKFKDLLSDIEPISGVAMIDPAFPYKRGVRTMEYQKLLQQADKEQSGDLVFWDQELQDRLNDQREAESMVTFELQAMRGMPGSSGIMKYSHSTIDTSKRYVLVVEDSKMIQDVLVEQLKSFNVEAIAADNGSIAVEKFTQFMREGVYFEMILMDIIMPVMGGYESTEQIRKIEKEFSITGADRHFICGFTAMVTSATAQKCSDCGMNRMLSKPMSADVLCQLLAENRRITNTFAEQSIGSKTMASEASRFKKRATLR